VVVMIEQPFNCIDAATRSKLLVSTRIKGILPGGTEMELGLLSATESVDLLMAVAEVDTAHVPPTCLEIARLCVLFFASSLIAVFLLSFCPFVLRPSILFFLSFALVLLFRS